MYVMYVYMCVCLFHSWMWSSHLIPVNQNQHYCKSAYMMDIILKLIEQQQIREQIKTTTSGD